MKTQIQGTNQTTKFFFYKISNVSGKKFIVAIREDEQLRGFSVGEKRLINSYIQELDNTNVVTNGNVLSASGSLLDQLRNKFETKTHKQSVLPSLINIKYVEEGSHLFSTDMVNIDFNRQSIWATESENFKAKMVNLIEGWKTITLISAQ